MTVVIWGAAAAVYFLFRVWYDGPRKPLTAAEIEEFMQILRARAESVEDTQDLEVLRRFMEEDDGREFIMTNLILFNPSPVTHPESGEAVRADSLLGEYFRPLMKMFLPRAGHPVLTMRAVGGYLDAWNTTENPGWQAVGLVRYRSRRDAVLASVAAAQFDGIHRYKVAALNQTFALPGRPQQGLFASPRVTVALVLALAAALVQLALG